MLLKGKTIRKKGILLALSSLPSKHGIGSLGKEAYRFIDFLKLSGQSYWQILPLCPLGKGNSPYASYGSFGGEILYIDLDFLVSDGLLTEEEIGNPIFPKNIDYQAVRDFKIPLLRQATSRFDEFNPHFTAFLSKNDYWLKDFCLFMAIKEAFPNQSFLDWEKGLKQRNPQALKKFRQCHKTEIRFFEITQYLFFCQYKALLKYAHTKGVSIIGDIPFYVDLESADIWANPQVFKLGRDMTPTLVAGVPPDAFCPTGQLWGNPIYNWSYLKNTDFNWWRQRLVHNASLYDIIRIDHFRGFADYFSIPSGSTDAGNGKWEKGIGFPFWQSVYPSIKNTEIIAEDLGGEDSPLVIKLLKETGFPNMKVLHFAFDSNLNDPFLPKNYNSNCVCYTGTHDNNTTLGWYKGLKIKEKVLFDRLVPKRYMSPVLNLISYALKSKADIVIIPMQDYLQLDASARLNTPGTPTGNWEWRFEGNDITEELVKLINSI